jgi:hypothetical protein
MSILTPPQVTEIEISLFGSGYGESIVAHIGDGNWLIVDSCIDYSSQKPIPLSYLESLNVDLSQNVVAVIATHWHDDHTKGLSKLVECCETAKFICSEALHFDEFVNLINMYSNRAMVQNPGMNEWSMILEQLRRRKKNNKNNGTPIFANHDQLLLNSNLNSLNASVKLWSLSPSDAAKIESVLEFRTLFRIKGQSRKAVPLPKRNPTSVALLLSISDTHILLGADLEEKGDKDTGWSAVISCNAISKKNLQYLKFLITAHLQQITLEYGVIYSLIVHIRY